MGRGLRFLVLLKLGEKLSVFIKNFNREQLTRARTKGLKGEVEIKNAELNEQVFQELLSLPSLQVVKVQCDSIKIDVPFTSLTTKPTKISLSNVRVILREPSVVSPVPKILKKKKSTAESTGREKEKAKRTLASKILLGIRLSCDTVHLVIDTLGHEKDGSFTSTSPLLHLELFNVEAFSTNHHWQQTNLSRSIVKRDDKLEALTFKEVRIAAARAYLERREQRSEVYSQRVDHMIFEGVPCLMRVTLRWNYHRLKLLSYRWEIFFGDLPMIFFQSTCESLSLFIRNILAAVRRKKEGKAENLPAPFSRSGSDQGPPSTDSVSAPPLPPEPAETTIERSEREFDGASDYSSSGGGSGESSSKIRSVFRSIKRWGKSDRKTAETPDTAAAASASAQNVSMLRELHTPQHRRTTSRSRLSLAVPDVETVLEEEAVDDDDDESEEELAAFEDVTADETNLFGQLEGGTRHKVFLICIDEVSLMLYDETQTYTRHKFEWHLHNLSAMFYPTLVDKSRVQATDPKDSPLDGFAQATVSRMFLYAIQETPDGGPGARNVLLNVCPPMDASPTDAALALEYARYKGESSFADVAVSVAGVTAVLEQAHHLNAAIQMLLPHIQLYTKGEKAALGLLEKSGGAPSMSVEVRVRSVILQCPSPQPMPHGRPELRCTIDTITYTAHRGGQHHTEWPAHIGNAGVLSMERGAFPNSTSDISHQFCSDHLERPEEVAIRGARLELIVPMQGGTRVLPFSQPFDIDILQFSARTEGEKSKSGRVLFVDVGSIECVLDREQLVHTALYLDEQKRFASEEKKAGLVKMVPLDPRDASKPLFLRVACRSGGSLGMRCLRVSSCSVTVSHEEGILASARCSPIDIVLEKHEGIRLKKVMVAALNVSYDVAMSTSEEGSAILALRSSQLELSALLRNAEGDIRVDRTDVMKEWIKEGRAELLRSQIALDAERGVPSTSRTISVEEKAQKKEKSREKRFKSTWGRKWGVMLEHCRVRIFGVPSLPNGLAVGADAAVSITYNAEENALGFSAQAASGDARESAIRRALHRVRERGKSFIREVQRHRARSSSAMVSPLSIDSPTRASSPQMFSPSLHGAASPGLLRRISDATDSRPSTSDDDARRGNDNLGSRNSKEQK